MNSDKHLLESARSFCCLSVNGGGNQSLLKRIVVKRLMFLSVVTCVKTASCSMDKIRLSFTIVSLVFECQNILTTASISVKRHMITINREISSKPFMEIQTDAPNFLQIIFFSKKHNQPYKRKSVFLGLLMKHQAPFARSFQDFDQVFDHQVYQEAGSTNRRTLPSFQ